MFGFGETPPPKTVYTDCLAEWRQNKVGDYNMFDTVLITGSKRSSPVGKIAVVYEYEGNPVFNEGGKYPYTVILKNGRKESDCSIKKYYGEMQSEFELMEEVTKETEELKRIETKYKAKAQKLAELSKRLDKDKIEALIKLHKTNETNNKRGK